MLLCALGDGFCRILTIMIDLIHSLQRVLVLIFDGYGVFILVFEILIILVPIVLIPFSIALLAMVIVEIYVNLGNCY